MILAAGCNAGNALAHPVHRVASTRDNLIR
jgi:hypothetical protein